MAGVRGFNDPNVQINPDGLPVWYQSVCFGVFFKGPVLIRTSDKSILICPMLQRLSSLGI